MEFHKKIEHWRRHPSVWAKTISLAEVIYQYALW